MQEHLHEHVVHAENEDERARAAEEPGPGAEDLHPVKSNGPADQAGQ